MTYEEAWKNLKEDFETALTLTHFFNHAEFSEQSFQNYTRGLSDATSKALETMQTLEEEIEKEEPTLSEETPE